MQTFCFQKKSKSRTQPVLAHRTAGGLHLINKAGGSRAEIRRILCTPSPRAKPTAVAPDNVVQRASDENTAQQSNDEPTGIMETAKDIFADPMGAGEEFLKDRLNRLANEPAKSPSLYSIAGCPETFCQPFDNYYIAQSELKYAGAIILAGIARDISPEVVPMWLLYLNGGSSLQNLSSKFGAEFTKNGKTSSTTQYLIRILERYIEQHQISLIGAESSVDIDFTTRLQTAIDEIDRPKSPAVMNFISGIPGNLAGGVGKDQVANQIGKTPSQQDDSRQATIRAKLNRNDDGSLTVTPTIRFMVKDTVDFCPGHCGGQTEQVATIPLSRFEATGLTGDVPFVVEFDAPASKLSPFPIPADQSRNPKDDGHTG